MIKRILIPLDGSKLAEKALPYAEELAYQFQAELVLMQVLQPALIAANYDSYVSFAYQESWPQDHSEAEAYLNSLRGELRELHIPARSIVLNSQPVADAIVDLAHEHQIDVIVMSTHGRSGLSRWIYGSVATKVLQQAPCPVFLVRAT